MMLMQIEAANIAYKRFFRIVKKRKNRHITFDQFALSNKKDLDAHPPFIVTVAEHISIKGGCASKSFLLDKRSEEHTSELQSRFEIVCRLPLEKKQVTLRSRMPN